MSIKNRFTIDSSILYYGDLARQLQNIEKISLIYYDEPNFSFNKLEIVKTKDDKEILKNQLLEKIQLDLFNTPNYQIFSI